MAANYPTNYASFTQKVDLKDLVVAADVNSAYDEIVSITKVLGRTPLTSGTWGANPFTTPSIDWPSLKDRIQNIENGVYTSFNDRVSLLGGSTITSNNATTIGLVIKAAASQSVNALEVRNSSNTVVAKVTATGALTALSIDGGTA